MIQNMNKRSKIILIALILLGIAVVGVLFLMKNELTVMHYEVSTDLSAPVRIVQLTDLHSWEFGEDNQEVVQLVAEQEPDLILMTGDMLDMSDENADVVCTLIEKLAAIAPVYYSHGNHERAWEQRNGERLEPELTASGAIVLDYDYEDITVNGQQLRIGGYYGYYRRPHMHLDDPAQEAADTAFCDAFEDTDRYKLLLCHIPTAWLDWGLIDDFPVDLVLTGHYHGGQIRIPFVGGLIAPYVGWFPEYTEGIYYGQQAACILSTGMGSSPNIPRINNPPQIIVVDLIPQN